MEVDEIQIIELELKYCERCGGLWLRRQGTEQVYCPPCLPRVLDETPPPRRARVRLPIAGDRRAQCCADAAARCAEGGHA